MMQTYIVFVGFSPRPCTVWIKMTIQSELYITLLHYIQQFRVNTSKIPNAFHLINVYANVLLHPQGENESEAVKNQHCEFFFIWCRLIFRLVHKASHTIPLSISIVPNQPSNFICRGVISREGDLTQGKTPGYCIRQSALPP